MSLRLLFLLVVAAFLLAGCASEPLATGQVPGAAFTDTTGAVRGIVTDESLLPIAGASVTIPGRDPTTTSSDGTFTFSLLEPGVYDLVATAPGFNEAASRTEVTAGSVASVSLRLLLLASDEAYSTTSQGSGTLGCGMAVGVRPAGVSQPANWCGVGTDYSYYGAPQLNDKYHVRINLAVPEATMLEAVVFETQWQSNQALSSGFMDAWYIEGKVSGIPRVWDYYLNLGEVQGRSPLKFALDRAMIEDMLIDADPSIVEKCAVISDCHWGAAVFPYADTLGSGYPVDFSLYVEQTFTHYITEFVGAPAPDGFTALADS